MHRRSILLLLTALALVGVSSATGSRAASSATLLIRHQQAHCHAWSLNGGPFQAAQSLQLARGATVTVMNNDVMPHRLIELSGPKATMRNGSTTPMGSRMHGGAAPGVMNHMGSTATVKLTAPGVYRFRTRAGEDYMTGIATTGEDNVLTLKVVVS